MQTLKIECPPMAVRNTGFFWQVTADRITDELVCRGDVGGAGLTITFPPCRVKYKSPGHWEVEEVLATGEMDSGEPIQILFPAEPVTREGQYLYAEEVDSIDERNGMIVSCLWTASARQRLIRAKLPRARSVPSGLGMRKYVVDAVTVLGTVED